MIWLLAFSYVAVAALLLNWSIRVRAPVLAKVGAIVLVSACYVFTYFGLRALQGWPTDARLPDNFRLQWITVEEPDKATGTTGQIFFWVRHLDGRDQPVARPRAYQLPFSEALAEDAQVVLEKIQGGQTVNGFVSREPINADALREEGDASGERGRRALAQDQAVLRIEFRDVPRPALPAKSAPSG